MSQFLARYIADMNEDFSKYCSEKLGDCGLSQGLISFLVYIGDHPNCSPTELANATDADSGYTTRSVKKLVSCGMATRQKHKYDGRAYVLKLTDLGMEKFYEVRVIYQDWEDKVTEGLDDSERALLMEVLKKLEGIE